MEEKKSDRRRRTPVTVAQIEVQPHNTRRTIEVQALTQRGRTPQTPHEQPPSKLLGPDNLLPYTEAAAFRRCHLRTARHYVRNSDLHVGSRSSSTVQQLGGGR